jgi:hypothetical protein
MLSDQVTHTRLTKLINTKNISPLLKLNNFYRRHDKTRQWDNAQTQSYANVIKVKYFLC